MKRKRTGGNAEEKPKSDNAQMEVEDPKLDIAHVEENEQLNLVNPDAKKSDYIGLNSDDEVNTTKLRI